MRPLVIVRPEPGASATAKAAQQLGLDPRVFPLFVVRPLEWEPPNPTDFDALLFTSANAIRHGGPGLEGLRDLPTHCVGEATAREARDYGFKVASVGSGRVDSLLQSLPGELRLLHLCGFHRREPATPTQAIRAIPVYRSDEVPASNGFRAVERSVIALHSPRAAARLGRLVEELGLARGEIALAAISPEAAEAAGTGWQALLSAKEPTDTALLAIAAELCKNPP
jgi:uroporphyrinogen-III synthase